MALTCIWGWHGELNRFFWNCCTVCRCSLLCRLSNLYLSWLLRNSADLITFCPLTCLVATCFLSRVPSSNPGRSLSVWSLHVFNVYVWVLFRYSSFLPLPKNIYVRLIGDSKIDRRSEWEYAWLSLWWSGDLSKVYPDSCPMTARIGSSTLFLLDLAV